MAQLHALVGAHLSKGEEDAEVIVAIETDRDAGDGDKSSPAG